MNHQLTKLSTEASEADIEHKRCLEELKSQLKCKELEYEKRERTIQNTADMNIMQLQNKISRLQQDLKHKNSASQLHELMTKQLLELSTSFATTERNVSTSFGSISTPTPGSISITSSSALHAESQNVLATLTPSVGSPLLSPGAQNQAAVSALPSFVTPQRAISLFPRHLNSANSSSSTVFHLQQR